MWPAGAEKKPAAVQRLENKSVIRTSRGRLARNWRRSVELLMEEEGRVRGYRARAEQLRVDAAAMTNPEVRQALLRMANSYEQMAKRISKSANPT